jgi:divalent metal cation (Fe/Co/Zn/Cd) transporter
LSLVAVVSLMTEAATGVWWVDSVGSIVIVWFLVREGREAWNNDDCGCC